MSPLLAFSFIASGFRIMRLQSNSPLFSSSNVTASEFKCLIFLEFDSVTFGTDSVFSFPVIAVQLSQYHLLRSPSFSYWLMPIFSFTTFPHLIWSIYILILFLLIDLSLKLLYFIIKQLLRVGKHSINNLPVSDCNWN